MSMTTQKIVDNPIKFPTFIHYIRAHFFHCCRCRYGKVSDVYSFELANIFERLDFFCPITLLTVIIIRSRVASVMNDDDKKSTDEKEAAIEEPMNMSILLI